MSKLSSGSGTSSADEWTSGNSTPAAAIRARACSNCRAELSSPTGRAPRWASKIDHCAAPHPSSSTSLPDTSPRTCSSDSGACQMPQRGSGLLMKSRWRSWYSSLVRSQCARLRRACSDGFPGNPDLLGGPAPGPFGRHVVVVRVVLRRARREAFVQGQDLEAILAQQPDHLPVREVVVHALVLARPLDPPEIRVRAQQTLLDLALVGRAQDREGRVAEEDQSPAGPKEPGRFRDPQLGIGPNRSAVLRDGDVEALIGQRDVLRARLDKLDRNAELLAHPARRLKLRRRRVDAGHPRPTLREPGAEICGPAPELDHVLGGDI